MATKSKGAKPTASKGKNAGLKSASPAGSRSAALKKAAKHASSQGKKAATKSAAPSGRKTTPKKVAAKRSVAKKAPARKIAAKNDASKKVVAKKAVSKQASSAGSKQVNKKAASKKPPTPQKGSIQPSGTSKRNTAARNGSAGKQKATGSASTPAMVELSEELQDKAVHNEKESQSMMQSAAGAKALERKEDPIMAFDMHMAQKASSKGDRNNKLRVYSTGQRPIRPSGKKPLW